MLAAGKARALHRGVAVERAVDNIRCGWSLDCDVSYCARTAGKVWSELVVAAGTVFNEVVIWKPSVTSADHTSPVLNRLTGHEVRISCNCSTTRTSTYLAHWNIAR